MASYNSAPLELDSTLSPLDALASHTRKLTVKRAEHADADSVHSAYSDQPSSSSHRPALHALLIPSKPHRSPLLSPQFSDVRHTHNHLAPLQPDPRQRDSAATFATDSTDYVWDPNDLHQDLADDGPISFSRPALARNPSTGHVTRSRARAETPREQVNSVYAHQELVENPLPTHSYTPHPEEPLEVLDRTQDLNRNTWASSAQSDSESEAGWESHRYPSGHSISSEDPFQYSVSLHSAKH